MFHILTYPWEAIGFVSAADSDPANSDAMPWHSQILVDQYSVITSATTGGTFPTIHLSKKYKVIELPGPAIKGDMSREIVIEINHNRRVSFQFDHNKTQNKNNKLLDQFECFFDQTMNAMLFLMRECLHVENHKTDNIYWDGILNEVRANIEEDPAKYALVVDLSRPRKLIEQIGRITEKPKRVLMRIHDQERIQKVQEIDIKCLTDLARRPGTVLKEKAGPKQRILAIKRTENINTLENRVTKHCCSLATLASKRYLLEHKQVDDSKSKRIRLVQKLVRACIRLPRKSSFTGVKNLIEPCRQPNYTLMQNPDYYKVWRAYVQLVRNEDLRHELWKWNRRMWSDFMGLFLADLLDSYQKTMSDEYVFSIGQKTVYGKHKQDMGKWLLSDTMPGPFIIDCHSNAPGTLYCIQGDHDTISNLFELYHVLAVLNADYLLLYIRDNKKVVLPIYAVLPPHHHSYDTHDRFIKNLLPNLMNNIGYFKNLSSDWSCDNGWVLMGNWANRFYLDKVQDLKEGITCWTTAINPDYNSWRSTAEKCYEPLLNVCGT